MDLKWISLLGEFHQQNSWLIFSGKQVEVGGQYQPAIGNFLCNQRFSGGTIEADIIFDELDDASACELILFYDPSTRSFLTAGLGGFGASFSIRHFTNRWTVLAAAGEKKNLGPGISYHVKAGLIGSQISLNVDGIDVLSAQMPFSLPPSQVGVWCLSKHQIRVGKYSVRTVPPKVFVVMEFSSPYNEIYLEVIKRISEEFEIEAVRADETFGPGIILTDIARQIIESKAVIAEITPPNPNVYYEIGYAHALGKPTILIADKSAKIPFDVSPFRILLYENTIPGKSRFEAGLRKHLAAIFAPGTGT